MKEDIVQLTLHKLGRSALQLSLVGQGSLGIHLTWYDRLDWYG